MEFDAFSSHLRNIPNVDSKWYKSLLLNGVWREIPEVLLLLIFNIQTDIVIFNGRWNFMLSHFRNMPNVDSPGLTYHNY